MEQFSFSIFVPGKCACRIMVQGFSYATPVTLTVPISISILLIFCGLRNDDPCAFKGVIPDYLFFHLPDSDFLDKFLGSKVIDLFCVIK
jgi:chitin synthase